LTSANSCDNILLEGGVDYETNHQKKLIR
jgi:hypothetical protein